METNGVFRQAGRL